MFRKKHANPLLNAVGNLGSKIFPAFREQHPIVSTMHGYYAYQMDFNCDIDHKLQAFQQNILNLRNFFIREHFENCCYRINNLLERAWNDSRNIITKCILWTGQSLSYSETPPDHRVLTIQDNVNFHC